MSRILSGSVVPNKSLLRADCNPQKGNPRYLIMVELRKRVWKKVGWDIDGKGTDPWAGKLMQGQFVGVENDEIMPEPLLGENTSHANTAMLEILDGDWSTNGITGLEGLDHILAGDPMDLFQWEEWESLASNFFPS